MKNDTSDIEDLRIAMVRVIRYIERVETLAHQLDTRVKQLESSKNYK